MDLTNLIVSAEPWQWFAIGGAALGLTGLLYGWGEDRPNPTWLLALLRLGTLGILGFLLLSPMLRSSTETRESPVLPVLVDATSSQWLGADSAARKTALDGLVADLPGWGNGVEWDVDLFSFDRELRALDGVDGQTWQPNGKRTDLGHAFESLRDRYVHRNVPAVLVVTDGRSNRGPDPEFSAERLEVPHLFVGTGDTSLVTDVEVSKLRTNEVAYLGNAFPVEITAKARGAANVPLTLRLYSGSALLESTTWTPDHEFSSTTWTVQVDADAPGNISLQSTIQAPEGWKGREVTQINNKKQATIEVLESRRRILIVAHAPHPDIAAIRLAAETNVHQETEVLWMNDLNASSSVPESDVLVLHQLDPTALPSPLVDAIQKSKALFILGGAATTWSDWDVNTVGFQMEAEPLITEARGLATDIFEPFPLPSGLNNMLALWPPLACPTGAYNTTPALRSAITQQVGPVTTDWPLWCIRDGGQRRTAMVLGEGLWRWRLQDLVRHDGTSQAFDGLVNRTLQYLSSRDDVERLRISVPERLDEDIRCQFTAEVYDAALTPTVDVDVNLSLTLKGGDPTTHRFVESTRGTDFELDLGMLLPGVYNWQASCIQNGESLEQRGTLIVNAVQAEASLTPANHGMLKRLAQRTEGGFLGTLTQEGDIGNLRAAWETFSSSLEARDVVHTSSERLPLHAQIWLLVVLLALLATEWAIRRSAGGR